MKKGLKKVLDTSVYDIYQKYKLYKLKKDAKKIITGYLRNTETKKLHIGAGGHKLEGWLNSDLEPQDKDIAFLNAGEIFPFADKSFDFIFSEHLLEHLNLGQQLKMVNECYRVLKPGGKMRIATPDFDFLIRLTSSDKNETEKRYLSWNMNAFLPQVRENITNISNFEVYVVNNYFRDWGHQLIHNKETISSLLNSAGFININFEQVGISNEPGFQNLEAHGEMITDEFNILETMIVEVERL